MKIQLKSDLHSDVSERHTRKAPYIKDHPEFGDELRYPKRETYVHPDAEVLILAGDIGSLKSVEYTKYLFRDVTIPILYIPGNHEYYDQNWFTLDDQIREALKDSNITYLQRDYKVINGVVFIGATLWTKLTDLKAILMRHSWSDFEWIKGLTLQGWQDRHAEDVHFIKSALKQDVFRSMKKVVITHHLPSEQSSPARFINHNCNPYYFTNLEDIILDYQPELWVHGHTHDNFDYMIDNTRVVCNPFGYFPSMLNPDFNKELILEI